MYNEEELPHLIRAMAKKEDPAYLLESESEQQAHLDEMEYIVRCLNSKLPQEDGMAALELVTWDDLQEVAAQVVIDGYRRIWPQHEFIPDERILAELDEGDLDKVSQVLLNWTVNFVHMKPAIKEMVALAREVQDEAWDLAAEWEKLAENSRPSEE